MASIYMRLDGVDVQGGATVDGLDGQGWFALLGYSWGGMRGVKMDIGNGNNTDSGVVALSEVNVTKQMDGASDALLSFFFVPGKEGKEIEIAFTKPSVQGEGVDVYYQVKLDKARLVSYNISGSEGGQPIESMSLSYVEISHKHNHENEGGELIDGGIVAFNVPFGKVTSATSL